MSSDDFAPASKQTITIAASFTAEPIAETLDFWFDALDITTDITFAPYNQLFQQLLDPNSLMSTVRHGMNVVLLRFGDWHSFRDLDATDYTALSQHLTQQAHQFAAAVGTFAAKTAVPLLVCICPDAPDVVADQRVMWLFDQLEHYLAIELQQHQQVWLSSASEIAESYRVTDYYDRHGDELGRIPFTTTFFAGIGTFIARTFYALHSAPYKVLVLDCDDTLWSGLCGEDGVQGIQMLPPYVALQRFVLRQYEAGMLICLCSKNSEADVAAVFAQRSDMLLSRDHIVAWRINWRPKSENIRSLANELQLGFDSFVVIDDNPLECAEIQAACPEVLTLQLPKDVEQIPHFLAHVWAFDRRKLTDEDRQRTVRYKQNAAREQLRTQSLTLDDFLAQLDLKITISPAAEQQYTRVVQLIQRTNQFNMAGIRRSESEIRALCESEGGECLVVEVGDRFGDYGLVGVILFTQDDAALNVDTFLLSCRVLGKRVEHQLLSRLGAIAQERGLRAVNLRYTPSERNQPALDFLNSLSAAHKQPLAEGFWYCLPTDQAALVVQQPTVLPFAAPQDVLVQADTLIPVQNTPDRGAKAARLSEIARNFASAAQIADAVAGWRQRERGAESGTFVAPRTATEERLSALWAQALGVDRVGIHDNFFALGGHSLLGTRLISRIRDAFEIELAQGVLFEAPTIAQLAELIEYYYIALLSTEELDSYLHSMDDLSDEQVKALLDQTSRTVGSR